MSRGWIQVTRGRPCQQCKAAHRCTYHEDGKQWKCCYDFGGVNLHRTGEDDVGQYAIYRDPDGVFDAAWEPQPEGLVDARKDALYRAMLGAMSLGDNERELTLARGMTDAQIEAMMLRSAPPLPEDAMMKALRDAATSSEELDKLPGYSSKKIIAPSVAIWIPNFSVRQEIVGIRLRKPVIKGKYVWLSSKSAGGMGPGARVYIPPTAFALPWDRVRLTEGEFKAEICTSRTGVPTISIPGVSAQSEVIHTLREMNATTVVVCFDADKFKRSDKGGPSEIFRALKSLVIDLQDFGFKIEMEHWPIEFGKGLDDVIINGHLEHVQLFRGGEVFDLMVEKQVELGGVPSRDDLLKYASVELQWKYTPKVEPVQRTFPRAPWEKEEPAAAVPVPSSAQPVPEATQSLALAVIDVVDAVPPTEAAPAIQEVRATPVGEEEPPPAPPPTAAPAGGGGGDGDPPDDGSGEWPSGPKDLPPMMGAISQKSHTEIAESVIVDLRALSMHPAAFARSRFWLYDYKRGIWRDATRLIERIIIRYDGIQLGKKQLAINAADIDGTMKVLSKKLDSLEFDNAPFGIAFRNGFLRMKPDGVCKLEDHAADQLQTNRLEMDYDPDAKAPTYDRFLSQIFSGYDTRSGEQQLTVHLLEEWLGAALFGMTVKFRKALVLYGVGRNGKSTLLDLMESLFPPSTRCSLEPELWGDPSQVVKLAGKKINVIHEVTDKALGSSSFKKIVAGNPTTAKFLYKDSFTFVPSCAQLMACNNPISVSDESDGMWDRIIALHFTYRVPESEIDLTLPSRLLAERAGIVARLVRAAERAMRQNGFTKSVTSTELKQEWKDQNSSLKAFLESECIPCEEFETNIADLHRRYAMWAEVTKDTQLSQRAFGIKLGTYAEKKRFSEGVRAKLLLRQGTEADRRSKAKGFVNDEPKNRLN